MTVAVPNLTRAEPKRTKKWGSGANVFIFVFDGLGDIIWAVKGIQHMPWAFFPPLLDARRSSPISVGKGH
jgi:hypothetical protein